MRIEVRIRDDEFKKELNRAIKKHVRTAVESNQQNILAEIKVAYIEKLRASDVYKSIVADTGKLRLDLGLESQVDAIEGVFAVLLDNVTITINRSANEGLDYIVPMTINLFDNKTLRELLSSEHASYLSDAWDEASIPWLEWLLLSGSRPVVIGYSVMYKDTDISRTGHAIMIKRIDGTNFSIDNQFSGTKEDNFITRAANDMVDEIELIVQKYLYR